MGLQVAAAGKIINEFTGLAFAGGEFETDNPAIRFVSAEAWTRDAQGAHITFATAPVGTSSPVEWMRLTSEGILLVGTDTASGSAKLQVSGAISVSGITYAGTLALSATGANPITLSTNGSEWVRVSSGGLFGIATASPLARLSVGDGSLSDGNFPVQISAGGTRAYYAVNRSDGNYGAGFGWDTSYGGVVVRSINASDDISLVTNSTTRAVTVKSGGNLLVGTTSDGNYKLDVAASGSSGTLRVYDQTATTGSTSLVVRAGAGQSTNAVLNVTANDGTTSVLKVLETKIGFFNATPVVKQTVTADAASILAALQAYGLAV